MSELVTSKLQSLLMAARSTLRQAVCPQCARSGCTETNLHCEFCVQRFDLCTELLGFPVETPAPRASRLPPPNPQLQAHISAVAAFMQELGPYLGLEDGLVTTGEFIEAAKRIRQWCSDHQRPLDFVRALKVAEGVLEQYGKDHRKWWRRMDGTPILNDVAVRMAEAFRIEANAPMRLPVETTREPPYRVRAFWSPEKRHLVTACCSMDDITLVDDNANIWEPTGPEEDVADPKNFQKEPDASPVKAIGDADGR